MSVLEGVEEEDERVKRERRRRDIGIIISWMHGKLTLDFY